MKLQGSLYFVSDLRKVEEEDEYTIRLDPGHFIYRAHFPGEPVTPGVCIMQIALELLEQSCGESLLLECARNIKFLNIISPLQTPVLFCRLSHNEDENGRVSSRICIRDAETVYAKLSLVCVKS